MMVRLARLLCRSGTIVLAALGLASLLTTTGKQPSAFGVSGHRMPYTVLSSHQASHKEEPIMTSSTPTCTTVEVLLTKENIKAHQWLENNGVPAPGVRFGGSIPMIDPHDDSQETQTIGTYTYLLTFLPNNDCVATGSYTFTTPDKNTHEPPSQITFTATCQALPYFSITGGQGLYSGATGSVEYQIPDGTKGYRHAINVCA